MKSWTPIHWRRRSLGQLFIGANWGQVADQAQAVPGGIYQPKDQ